MSPKRLLPLFVVAFSFILAAPGASAGNKGICLFSRDIVRVEAPDRDHLLFFMKNGKVWENTLWQRCWRLRPWHHLDWGQDDFDKAVCTWPQSGPPYPVVDGRNPADTRPQFHVSLRNGLGACTLGKFTPYAG